MISASEERFRLLFQALDAENEWNKQLTQTQLCYVRVAADSAETWLPFLTGIPPAKKRDTMEVDSSADILKQDEVRIISAIVRKRLTFAAIDEDFYTHPSDGHERDQGLMPGDDGGYTDYDQLIREEDALQRKRTSVYSLLGCHGDDITRMPFPLFGGRVREVLREGLRVCEGEAMEALKIIVETEARDGYETTEECLKAIESFLSAHREALGDGRNKIESRVITLRSEHDKLESWFTARKTSNDKLSSMLGTKLPLLETTKEASQRPPCDESTLRYRATGKAPTSSPKRPRVPQFQSLPPAKADTRSLWEMLGPRNAIVKNLTLYERVMKLKGAMYKLQGISPPAKSEPVLPAKVEAILEIRESGEAREKKLTEAGVALVLSHAGFTYADSAALDLITGVFEKYIRDTGRALISTRENIDNNAASVAERLGRRRVKSREEVIAELEVVLERVKGGFPELYNYVRADIMRTEKALREVEARMRIRIRQLADGKGEGKGATILERQGDKEVQQPISEKDIVLGEGLAFGYLGEQVWIDVLDGIRVPRKLVNVDGVKEEAMVVDS